MALWNTCLYFLNVPLDKENNHTYYFGTKDEQTSHMMQKSVHSPVENYSYQRKDQIIRVHIPFDESINCNYVMYRNTDYSNKWYYAFVKDMKYVDNGRTDLYIETDVLQTWMFDYSIGTCFIEREHVDDDIPGLHTQPEQIETGEYVGCDIDVSTPVFYDKTNCCGVVAVSEFLGKNDLQLVENYEIPNGLYYIACADDKTMKRLIKAYADNGKADAVQFVFTAPKDFFGLWVTYTAGDDEIGSVSFHVKYEVKFDFGVKGVNSLGMDYQGFAYYPTNKKLLSFPYSFLQVSNNIGSVVNYKYEDFIKDENDEYHFEIIGTIAPGCAFKCYPIDYKNIAKNYDEGINLGKLPIGSWDSDVYTNWLTQNSVNIAVSSGASLISIVAGAVLLASGGGSAMGAGLLGSGLLGVGKSVGEVYQHSLIPDQASGNTNCGDVNYQFGLSNLTFKRMSIKPEYARVIDGYFTMYGYKVNRVKKPNSNHRKAFWFTKTIDANVQGAIPKDDLTKIIDCYNKGITSGEEHHHLEIMNK